MGKKLWEVYGKSSNLFGKKKKVETPEIDIKTILYKKRALFLDKEINEKNVGELIKEMLALDNLSDKDIKLSPGIKEVLRGWGYIQ